METLTFKAKKDTIYYNELEGLELELFDSSPSFHDGFVMRNPVNNEEYVLLRDELVPCSDFAAQVLEVFRC